MKPAGIVQYVDSLRAVVEARELSIKEGYAPAILDQILRSELGRSTHAGQVRPGTAGSAVQRAT
jgi:hypothetical protein